LSFIYLVYPEMTLLLGDISRNRMAIDDTDRTDKRIWAGLARYWYSKASEKSPTAGIFYHHLAILSPNALQQLFSYSKSLCVQAPYPETQDSILTVFNKDKHGMPLFDRAILKAHKILFTGKEMENFGLVLKEVLDQFDAQIEMVTFNIAIVNITAMLGFGSKEALLMKAISPENENGVSADQSLIESFKNAQLLNSRNSSTER
jgi:hypothetical protein